MAPRLKIGLTGGIASGKSSAARCFNGLGAPIIDADLLARDLVEPGQPGLNEILRHFGPRVLTPQGRLDRRALREEVFARDGARHLLDGILHPRIRDAMQARVMALNSPYCILCIPLLVETDHFDLVDRVLVVDAPKDLQIARATARDDVSATQIRAIIEAQASRKERLAVANDIISNDSGLDELTARVGALHIFYSSLATTDLPAKDE